MLIPLLAAFLAAAPPLDTTIVRPKEIDTVLVNPGIGFTTFQRFNGDTLNAGTRWTEGYPIEYQPFHGNLEVKGPVAAEVAHKVLAGIVRDDSLVALHPHELNMIQHVLQ